MGYGQSSKASVPREAGEAGYEPKEVDERCRSAIPKTDVTAVMLFLSIFICCLSFVFCFCRWGLAIPWRAVLRSTGIASLLVLGPPRALLFQGDEAGRDWFRRFAKCQIVMVLVLFALGLTPPAVASGLGLVAAAAGYLILVSVVGVLVPAYCRESLFARNTLIAAMVVVPLWANGLWGYGHLDPLFFERLAKGDVARDPLQVTAYAEMAINGMPAEGLNGLSYLHYHWLAYGLLGVLSRLAAEPVLSGLQVLFPLAVAPLLLLNMLLLAIRMSACGIVPSRTAVTRSLLFWLFFLLPFVGTLPSLLREKFFVASNCFSSPSQSLSLSLSLLVMGCVLSTFEGRSPDRWNGVQTLLRKSAATATVFVGTGAVKLVAPYMLSAALAAAAVFLPHRRRWCFSLAPGALIGCVLSLCLFAPKSYAALALRRVSVGWVLSFVVIQGFFLILLSTISVAFQRADCGMPRAPLPWVLRPGFLLVMGASLVAGFVPLFLVPTLNPGDASYFWEHPKWVVFAALLSVACISADAISQMSSRRQMVAKVVVVAWVLVAAADWLHLTGAFVLRQLRTREAALGTDGMVDRLRGRVLSMDGAAATDLVWHVRTLLGTHAAESLAQQRRESQIDSLMSLRKEIPRTCGVLVPARFQKMWRGLGLDCDSAAFLVPATLGRAAVWGLPPVECSHVVQFPKGPAWQSPPAAFDPGVLEAACKTARARGLSGLYVLEGGWGEPFRVRNGCVTGRIEYGARESLMGPLARLRSAYSGGQVQYPSVM